MTAIAQSLDIYQDCDLNIQPTSGVVAGHEWVDLGLPSGTLWATCNVGATAPEEYGDYFAWGETTPKATYSWSTYQYGSSSSTLTKYCNNSSYGLNGFTDNKTILDAEDDAATVNWGSGWRMPTFDEIDELKKNTTATWTIQNGVNGWVFTAPNGNAIFLPAAGYAGYDGDILYRSAGRIGYYWSSSLYKVAPSSAYNLYFYSDAEAWNLDRCYGRSVRPVVRTNAEIQSETLLVSPVDKDIKGGSFTIEVTSNTSWIVSCNQSWVSLSTNAGNGDGAITVTVPFSGNEVGYATISISTVSGSITQTVSITRRISVASN